MQFKVALVALAASLVSAQIDLTQIPTCALPPAAAALSSSGCPETDVKCICGSTAFLTSLLPAVEKVCSAADLAKAESFAYNLCLAAGITIAIPGTASPTSAAPVASSSAAPPATTAAPPASSAAGVSTVYVTVPCTTSSAVIVPTTKASNVTVTPTKSATPSVFTGAAAASYVSGATMFGGVMAALAMLL